jgi:cell division protein FtsW
MNFFKIGIRNQDYLLISIIYILAFIGLGVMLSASFSSGERDFGNPYFFFNRQLIWLLGGLIIFIVFSQLDFRILENMGLYLCLVTIFLLILVFVPGLGKSVGTNYGRNFNRWIGIGPFQIQPSEFAKITILIYLSGLLKNFSNKDSFKWSKIIIPSTLIGSILLLIVLEPSFGTTMEILFVLITMIYIAGFSFNKLFISTLSILPLLFLLVDRVGYRRKRIDIWLDPYSYRYEEGHQLVSSYLAFKYGSWFGTDISSGYSHRYLPYSYTDFIISPFVEDFGFLGFLFLLSSILILIFRAFFLMEKVEDPFGFYLGSGIIAFLSIQFLMNFFVVTGILPITGVSFPFLSYGGSSLISTFIFSGILVNITRKENLEP